MNADDRSRTCATPDEDPRSTTEDEPRNATSREIVDDWLWEHYGFGVEQLEEKVASSGTGSFDGCTSERVEAVAPNAVTAGINVRRVDVDEEFTDMPFMVEVEQHFPPEDGRDGDAVALHGEHAVFQLIAALADVTSSRFEEVPWDDV